MTERRFQKNDRVLITLRNREEVKCTFSHYAPNGKGYLKGDNNKSYERDEDKITLISKADNNGNHQIDFQDNKEAEPVQTKKHFHINKRFEFLASFVKMTAQRKRNSLIITGDGGLGKTHTVLDVVGKLGLEPIDPETGAGHYKLIKGYSTARGLYNTMYEFSDKLIIFDDCDEVLENSTAKNILKGGLDSYERRLVSWVKHKEGGDTPSEFEFTGSIIFISNLRRNMIDQAVLTRSTKVDVSMTVDEKIERMRYIIEQPSFQPEIEMEDKLEALRIIEENKHACNLSIRTLLEVLDYKTSGEENWQELAEYVMYS